MVTPGPRAGAAKPDGETRRAGVSCAQRPRLTCTPRGLPVSHSVKGTLKKYVWVAARGSERTSDGAAAPARVASCCPAGQVSRTCTFSMVTRVRCSGVGGSAGSLGLGCGGCLAPRREGAAAASAAEGRGGRGRATMCGSCGSGSTRAMIGVTCARQDKSKELPDLFAAQLLAAHLAERA
jgi:hypothetical protein